MSTLPTPTIVIFDMDGTTIRHIDPRMLHFMERIDDIAFKISRLWGWVFARKAKGPIILPPPDTPIKPPKSILVHKALHKLRRQPLEVLVEPCPGIYSVLALLKKQNIPMALVSNGLGKGYGEEIVQKFGLDNYFPITIFREDIRKSKPNPEPILKAIQHLNRDITDKDVIWYIGDRHKDITATQNAQKHVPAKMVPIAYALNAAIATIEKGYGPDHIIMSYQDMYTILKENFNE